MRRLASLVAIVVVSVLLVLGRGVALADGGKGIVVKPLTPKPGEAVTVKGDLLGSNSTVEVRVVGSSVNVDLGEVKGNDEGDFTEEFRLPADLAPGTYQVQAKGAETATTEITVVAVGGKQAGEEGQAGNQTTVPETTSVRDRAPGETAALVAFLGVLAGLGLFFARTAKTTASS